MKVYTIQAVLELNARLAEQSIPCKIHMRDACGGQSFWIEEIDAEYNMEKMRNLIDNYFLGLKGKVEFYDSDGSFRVI